MKYLHLNLNSNLYLYLRLDLYNEITAGIHLHNNTNTKYMNYPHYEGFSSTSVLHIAELHGFWSSLLWRSCSTKLWSHRFLPWVIVCFESLASVSVPSPSAGSGRAQTSSSSSSSLSSCAVPKLCFRIIREQTCLQHLHTISYNIYPVATNC